VTESEFWGKMKPFLAKSAIRTMTTRVENSAVSGMPDVCGRIQGGDFWFELKIVKSDHVVLRHSQAAWMYRRQVLGARNIFVLALDKNTLVLTKGCHILGMYEAAKARDEDPDSKSVRVLVPAQSKYFDFDEEGVYAMLTWVQSEIREPVAKTTEWL